MALGFFLIGLGTRNLSEAAEATEDGTEECSMTKARMQEMLMKVNFNFLKLGYIQQLGEWPF